MSGYKKASNSSPSASDTNNIEKPNDQNAAEGDAGVSTVTDVKPNLKPSVSDEYIRVCVINSDKSSDVYFRLKADTPLIRLKKSYSSQVGLEANVLRFVFDGHRITDDDTPRKLGLVNDDIIEIYQEAIGGGV